LGGFKNEKKRISGKKGNKKKKNIKKGRGRRSFFLGNLRLRQRRDPGRRGKNRWKDHNRGGKKGGSTQRKKFAEKKVLQKW